MAKDLLGYERMLQEALRGVVREALSKVAASGFPPGHHFYITFRSDYPGVEIPDFLRAQYPHEMTIVIQYQYSGLEVGAESFSVSLSFNKMPCTLTVPFASLVRFADPSVDFGLQLAASLPVGPVAVPADGASNSSAAGGDAGGTPKPARSGESKSPPGAAAPSENEEPSAKVVTLDSFRKS